MEGDRRSRILGGMSADARNVTIALVSTVVFFTVLVLVITNSPGWPEVKTAFFNPTVFREAFPEVLRAFWLNIKIFCVAEVFILAFALVIAVLRSLPGPVFFPIRALAIVYTDFFRGIPTILLIFILGFGVPALGLSGVPTSALVWATVALIIIYSPTSPRCIARGSSRCTRARTQRRARLGSPGRSRSATSSFRRRCAGSSRRS